MRARGCIPALWLLFGAASASAQDSGPPQAVPERARASSPSISASAPSIGAPAISIGFSDHAMSEEEIALQPRPPAPAPPVVAGLEVKEVEGGVRYTLSADILFDFDKATLRPQASAALKALSEDVRRRFPEARFLVDGYTDAKGSDAYNLKLSKRRAESVKDFLVKRQDFAAGTVDVEGRGEANPVAPNETPEGLDDPEGRQKNRRVEILVKPPA